MRRICGIISSICSGLLLAGIAAATPAAAQPPERAPRLVSGLICDTQEQAERFVVVLRENVETAIGTVNDEAGTLDACMVATYGFIPGQTISEVVRNGSSVNVIEVRVLAVVTASGLQMVEPKIYYSVLPTRDRVA